MAIKSPPLMLICVCVCVCLLMYRFTQTLHELIQPEGRSQMRVNFITL